MTQSALWTRDDMLQATGGQVQGTWSEASGISIDTRTLQPGDFFVALQGPNFDGHDFVADALNKGAAAAMVHHRTDKLPSEANLLIVDDTLGALWRLGAAARQRSSARFLAVTGSVGKTGTKEALKACLSAQAATSANIGSLNNHWGVPLSLARMPADVVYGVFELGMNNPGEILELSRLVRPDTSIITNIEAAHIGNFESISKIADAKAEIFEPMDPDGVAILNRDHPMFHHLRDKAEIAGLSRIIGFGRHPDSVVRLLDHTPESEATNVRVSVDGRDISYRIGLPGFHWVLNSMAVLAAVWSVGADVAAAAAELDDLEPLKGRGARHEIMLPGGAFQLIDDSYNANPASVRAALEVLGGVTIAKGGRRIAVLGDMLELGNHSRSLHEHLAAPAAESAELVFTCGPEMKHLYDALPKERRGGHGEDSNAAADMIAKAVQSGDTVLVKGSLGSKMQVVVDALLSLHEDLPKAANGD